MSDSSERRWPARAAFFTARLLRYLWGLFRAVGAGRKTALDRHPPTCESCGYNLTAAEMDGRCPECGEAVYDSLGPQVRP